MAETIEHRASDGSRPEDGQPVVIVDDLYVDFKTCLLYTSDAADE